MRRLLKYLSVFSMWLAGIALCAHLILPHDHHISDTFTDQEKNCPASDTRSGHNSGSPIHCHAFNVIASEEQKSYQILNKIEHNSIPFLSFSDPSAFKLQVSLIRIIDLQKPIPDLYALELSLLRAPPSIA